MKSKEQRDPVVTTAGAIRRTRNQTPHGPKSLPTSNHPHKAVKFTYMDQTNVEVFPIDTWGQRLILILNLSFFSLIATIGILTLIKPLPNQGPWVSIGLILFGLLFALVGILTLKAKWNASIEIDGDVFRFYQTKSDLNYEKNLEYVFSLQSAQVGLAFKPNVFLIHFCDGRRFTFSSKMTRSQELRKLLETRTQKVFDPGSRGPTSEESLPYRMSEEEIDTFVHKASDWMDKTRNIPANLEEARARFGESLVGNWSEANFTSPPIESSLTILPDGYAIVTWTRMFGDTSHELLQWRQLGPFKIETRHIDAKGTPSDWHTSEYSIEEFRMFENSKPSYQLKGAFGGMIFSSSIAPDLTYEKIIADHPLNLESDDED